MAHVVAVDKEIISGWVVSIVDQAMTWITRIINFLWWINYNLDNYLTVKEVP